MVRQIFHAAQLRWIELGRFGQDQARAWARVVNAITSQETKHMNMMNMKMKMMMMMATD